MILINVCIIILSICARVILVFDYPFYAYCLIHLSLFPLGNLEYISWTLGTGFFFFFGCVCFIAKKCVVFLLCTKNNILYKTIPGTFVAKRELNLAYYSAYKLQLGKPSPKIKLQLGKDHSQSLTVYADSYVRKRGLMKWR